MRPYVNTGGIGPFYYIFRIFCKFFQSVFSLYWRGRYVGNLIKLSGNIQQTLYRFISIAICIEQDMSLIYHKVVFLKWIKAKICQYIAQFRQGIVCYRDLQWLIILHVLLNLFRIISTSINTKYFGMLILFVLNQSYKWHSDDCVSCLSYGKCCRSASCYTFV